MAKTITIANQKGGVGKTTTALCLGACLESRGYKVLYIDLDKQCNASKVLQADTSKKGAYNLLTSEEQAKDLIQVTDINANVISSSEGVASVKNYVNLREKLKGVSNNYDFIVVDTPPNLDGATLNALASTDYLIAVSNADTFSLDGINDMQKIINSAKKPNPSLKINGILVARFNQRTKLDKALKQITEQVATAYHTKTYKTYIRENIAVRESQTAKERITDYAPNSKGCLDYQALTDEVLEDMGVAK